MAKRFLASTGVGYLFQRTGGELEMVARVNTLTESTLGITSTQEEVRAGQGAKLYGRFNHDAGLTVTLTDAMFDLNYIKWQVGAEIQHDPSKIYHDEGASIESTTGKITFTGAPTVIGKSCGLDSVVVWYRAAGCSADDAFRSHVLTETEITAKSFTDDEMVGVKDICLYYFTLDNSAKSILIKANFVPAELVLVLTTKLFAGDANNPETGKPVGEITIKIPRFSLDGAFDLSMAMSSAATMSLNGTALATDDGTCDGDGIYAEIVEVVEGADWKDGLIGLVVDEDTLTTAEMPVNYQIVTYGVYKDSLPAVIDPTLLNYTSVGTTAAVIDESGKVTTAPTAAGTITIGIKGETTGKYAEEKATITVTLAE